MKEKSDVKIVQEALENPRRVFGVPENVAKDGHLKKEDRLLILENWALDLHALNRADDENMAGAAADIPPAELLRRIDAARRTLLNVDISAPPGQP